MIRNRRAVCSGFLKATSGASVLAHGLALAMPMSASAQAVNFAGKTVEWIIPFGVGGGSDVLARFNAPFLSKYLPGQPNVVLKNVAGGGSVTGANQFNANARPDGLTLLITSGSTQFPYLLGDPRVKFDYKDWEMVLAGPTGGVAYISSRFGVQSVKDLPKLKGQKLTYGSQGATSLDLVPMLAFRMLGLDVQHVFGMKSRSEGRLAFERGEATIAAFSRRIEQSPMAMTELLLALEMAHAPLRELVLVGAEGCDDAAFAPFLQALRTSGQPNRVLVRTRQGPELQRLGEIAPLVREKVARGGKVTAYVCVHGVCKLPTTEPAQMVASLRSPASGSN